MWKGKDWRAPVWRGGAGAVRSVLVALGWMGSDAERLGRLGRARLVLSGTGRA